MLARSLAIGAILALKTTNALQLSAKSQSKVAQDNDCSVPEPIDHAPAHVCEEMHTDFIPEGATCTP